MAAAAIAPKLEPDIPDEAAWMRVENLPCDFTADLQLPEFTVADLAGMKAGVIIDSCWNVTDDVPLRVNGELIAWGEFEVTNGKLAVRLTELA
jgi:flagellar motor switch/type III secretory pathway protein FliN